MKNEVESSATGRGPLEAAAGPLSPSGPYGLDGLDGLDGPNGQQGRADSTSAARSAAGAAATGASSQNGVPIPAHEFLRRWKSGEPCTILDVRTPAEFAASHLEGSVLLPLDRLSPEALQGALGALSPVETVSAPVYVLCQSGGRATHALKKMQEWGIPGCSVVDGGMDACAAAGAELVRGESRVLPLMRQVQLVIGTVSALGAGLALWVDTRFAWIPLFTGLGLFYAGLTGTCGLALLLGRMPWNQAGGGKGTRGAGQ